MPQHLYVSLLLVPPAFAQLGPPPVPAGNPITADKAMLGKILFWEEQLSTSRTISCGTCHVPASGGSDPRSRTALAQHPGLDRVYDTEDDVFASPSLVRSTADGLYLPETYIGFHLELQVTRRKALPVMMAAYAPEVLWDGAASATFLDPETGAVVLSDGGALESQAAIAIASPAEMAHVDQLWSSVVARLESATPLRLAQDAPDAMTQWIADRPYPELFAQAFGDPEITGARIGMALATYERTLVPDQTPYDAYLAGDSSALTTLEAEGRAVFEAVGCAECHSGPELTNHRYEYIGVRPAIEDRGRFYVTLVDEDRARMRVPSLRNLELRAPYFHNGQLDTIAEVVDFFDRGGDFVEFNKSPLIRPLHLTQAEKDALVAFLGRPLTDPRVRDELPPFDRPRLDSESGRGPHDLGGGVPDSGGAAPRMIAHEPPYVGNPSLTLGVQDARGGAPALLLLGGRVHGSGPLFGHLDGDVQVLHVGALDGEGAGGGYGSVSIPIPNDPSLVGQSIEAQWIVRDVRSTWGIAATNAVRLTWF